LFHCRKPIGHLRKRSTADGKADVLKLVSCEGSRLEPREAIQAGDFAKPVDCHEGTGEIRVADLDLSVLTPKPIAEVAA
jgi:hypothetical protein